MAIGRIALLLLVEGSSDDGSWLVGFSIKFRAINPAAAELITVREGLVTAKRVNIQHLELEADAEALKMMLENADKFTNHAMLLC